MTEIRERIVRLFLDVGTDYSMRRVAGFELYQDQHDVHAFFRPSSDGTVVVHVQGYPGRSSDEEAVVWARMMDYGKMIDIRRGGGVSVGNEHEATTQEFPNFGLGIMIPYDSQVLRDKLAENVPELG